MFGGLNNCNSPNCQMSRHYTNLYNEVKSHTTFVMRLYAYGSFTQGIFVKINKDTMLEWL